MNSLCQGHRWARRHFLFGAARTITTGAMATVLRAQGSGRARSTAQTCIFVNLGGGASQLDTFDAKDGPWNPADADLQKLAGGLVFSQRYFPRLSRLASELAVIRSANAHEIGHERARFRCRPGTA